MLGPIRNEQWLSFSKEPIILKKKKKKKRSDDNLWELSFSLYRIGIGFELRLLDLLAGTFSVSSGSTTLLCSSLHSTEISSLSLVLAVC